MCALTGGSRETAGALEGEDLPPSESSKMPLRRRQLQLILEGSVTVFLVGDMEENIQAERIAGSKVQRLAVPMGDF